VEQKQRLHHKATTAEPDLLRPLVTVEPVVVAEQEPLGLMVRQVLAVMVEMA
jgi:hypothetical protein